MAKKHILLVEDEEDILALMHYNLMREGFRVSLAMTGEEGLAAIREDPPDLVVLDLMLPNMDGLEVCRVIKSTPEYRNLAVVMVTARGEEADVVAGLELGADDYVTKPFNPREVVARVRAVLRRSQGEAAPARVLHVGALTVDLDQHLVTVAGESINLTPTEFSLLQALAQHPGHTLTRLELIEVALGYSYEGMERTVDTHIKNLRKKITQAGAPKDLIQTVFGVGYRLSQSESV